MKTDDIEKLLDRYYDGATDEAEERELKRFFCEEDVPAHLSHEKELFLQLHDATDVPAGLEERLSRNIDKWAGKEKPSLFSKRKLQWTIGIAASLLILFGLASQLDVSEEPKDTCATPEEAYIHARYALVTLSENLNKGINGMHSIKQTSENIEKQITKQLNIKQ